MKVQVIFNINPIPYQYFSYHILPVLNCLKTLIAGEKQFFKTFDYQKTAIFALFSKFCLFLTQNGCKNTP